MREYILYMWLGVWLFLLPFLGVPGEWKDMLLGVTALCIVLLSFFGYRRTRVLEPAETDGTEIKVTEETEPSAEPK